MSVTIPDSMQAVQLESYGGSLAVRQCLVPRPGSGEVLVRMAGSPINSSDLSFLHGSYKYQKPLPIIPGIEGSGTVVAAGPGLLPRLLLGNRVACASSPTSGGTWAEYMVTSAKWCAPLQGNVTFEQGAMMLVNPLTALAFIDIAKREKHAAIVSTAAASALGRMILQLGRQNGIPILSIVRRKEQVDLVHALGGEYVLDSSRPDFGHQLRTLSRQLKATLLLDAVAGGLTGQLLEAAPAGSTVMVYAYLSREQCVIDPRGLLYDDKRLVGFYLANWLSRKNFLQSLQDTRRVQRLLATHLQTTVQRRLPLSAAQQAVDLYRNNMSAGKALLVANPQEIPLER